MKRAIGSKVIFAQLILKKIARNGGWLVKQKCTSGEERVSGEGGWRDFCQFGFEENLKLKLHEMEND